jgi:hypothetical protein
MEAYLIKIIFINQSDKISSKSITRECAHLEEAVDESWNLLKDYIDIHDFSKFKRIIIDISTLGQIVLQDTDPSYYELESKTVRQIIIKNE